MPGKVLVTGISSFTGPYLAEKLVALGYEVVGLSNNHIELSNALVLPGNLLDADGLRQSIDELRPDFVIHLAAITFVPHGDIAEMYMTNVVGTRNLLQALAESETSPQKVILASSANVYGNTVEGELAESTAFSPANDYAASKVAMEFMAGIWLDRLPISIVRPFNYTGVGQADKFLIPKIVSHFQQKKSVIELGNIDVVRDFSDVRFVADAYAALLQKAEVGEAYNLCSGEGHSLKSLIKSMNEIAGYEIEVTVNPAFVRENEVRRLVGSNEKLLGLCPELSPVDMRDTLAWMFQNKP
ncbi:MAG: GDP-mannose 4,6-dehydratase [Halioglobus sp.]